VTASIPRRIAAWFFDYLVVMVPGLTAVLAALTMLLQALPAYLGGIAAEAGWGFLFRLFTGGTAGAELSAGWIGFATPLIAALLFVPLLQFVYQGIMLSWRGRTFGKMVFDIRVTAAGGGPQAVRPSPGSALGRAFLTTTLETGLIGIALVLLTIGQFLLATLVWLGVTAAFWLNAFTLLGSGRRTLVDRLCGTSVVHRGLYAEVAGRAAVLARRGTAAIRAGLTPTPAIGAHGTIVEGRAVPMSLPAAGPPAIEQHPVGAWQQQQAFAPLPPPVDPFADYDQQTQAVRPPTLPLPTIHRIPPQPVAPQTAAPQTAAPQAAAPQVAMPQAAASQAAAPQVAEPPVPQLETAHVAAPPPSLWEVPRPPAPAAPQPPAPAAPRPPAPAAPQPPATNLTATDSAATDLTAETQVVVTQPIAPSPPAYPRTVSDTLIDLERIPAADSPAQHPTVPVDAGGPRSIRDYPGAILHSDPVQRAINSRAGQQAQALGAAGAEKAQQFGEQAVERARRLGSRAQDLWRQRKDDNAQGQEPPGR
jgi:uncharacterized RDD family membrane protein YckC